MSGFTSPAERVAEAVVTRNSVFDVTKLTEGSSVFVLDDLGKLWSTKTRSAPWKLGHGTWVVLLEGRTGGYDVGRIFLRQEPEALK